MTVGVKPAIEPHKEPRKRPLGIWLIAVFKLIKGALLIAVGIGALSLLHKDVAETATHWIAMIRIDPDNRFAHKILLKLGALNARKLEELSIGTFIYASLFVTEGVGLLLGKRWAEYFTIIVTLSLVPLEIYELVEHPSIAKVGVLLINVGAVWYLARRLRQRK